jgi:transposase
VIDAELFARIRRLYFAEHWRVGTIATELGIHHDTVERAIGADRFGAGVQPVRPSLLDPYKDFIRQTLERHPRLRATRLFAMVRERGYPGSYPQVRRYVATVRPRPTEAYLRLETLPGEQGQVDWGHFGKLTIGAARRPLVCFVMVLSHSRAMYARFALDLGMESFVRGHIEAFEAFGGVPRQLLYDNLKSVVLDRVGNDVRFHPRILELAGHYHFAPVPCAPYRGNEKGKVERTIQYLRHAFFAARTFSSVSELNRQLHAWIADTAHERPCPRDPDRRSVGDVFAAEKPRLLQLPDKRFETDLVRAVTSGKQPYVRFDRNDYSIPHTLVRVPVTLIASEDEVRIADATGVIVARHVRSWSRGDVVEDPAHIHGLAQEKRRARDLRGRDRLRRMCPAADAFLDAAAQRGEALSVQVQRLHRLLDAYGAADLDSAMADAFERGAIAAASVGHILDQRARAKANPPPLDVVLPANPAVRELRVVPHSLADYDQLATDDPEDHDDSRE